MRGWRVDYREHINSRYWYKLRDFVKLRCGGKCEFCSLRRMSQLHHRHYGSVGHERLEDVMGVCVACHRMIEDLFPPGHEIAVEHGSLATKGDHGRGSTEAWEAYLDERNAELLEYAESLSAGPGGRPPWWAEHL